MAIPLGLRSNSASAQTTVCSLGIGKADFTFAELASVNGSGDSWNEPSSSCARVASIALRASCTLGAYSAFSASSLSASFSSRTAFAPPAAPATAAPAVAAASTIAAPAAVAAPVAPSAILAVASPAVLAALWISCSGSKPLSNMLMDDSFSWADRQFESRCF